MRYPPLKNTSSSYIVLVSSIRPGEVRRGRQPQTAFMSPAEALAFFALPGCAAWNETASITTPFQVLSLEEFEAHEWLHDVEDVRAALEDGPVTVWDFDGETYWEPDHEVALLSFLANVPTGDSEIRLIEPGAEIPTDYLEFLI